MAWAITDGAAAVEPLSEELQWVNNNKLYAAEVYAHTEVFPNKRGNLPTTLYFLRFPLL